MKWTFSNTLSSGPLADEEEKTIPLDRNGASYPWTTSTAKVENVYI